VRRQKQKPNNREKWACYKKRQNVSDDHGDKINILTLMYCDVLVTNKTGSSLDDWIY
jgi:hypothetical protein